MERDIREEMEEGSTFLFYSNLRIMSSIYILGWVGQLRVQDG